MQGAAPQEFLLVSVEEQQLGLRKFSRLLLLVGRG